MFLRFNAAGLNHQTFKLQNGKFKQQFNKRRVVRAFVLLVFCYTLFRSRTISLLVNMAEVKTYLGNTRPTSRVWDTLGYITAIRGKRLPGYCITPFPRCVSEFEASFSFHSLSQFIGQVPSRKY